MKRIDTNTRTKEELHALLKDQREQLRRLYFDMKLGKVQDTSACKRTKKDIARILRVLHITYGDKT